jgi:4-hydroxy-tetrahydrodipicolinate reductase
LGVAVLTEAIRVLGKLKGADFQIEEFHHNKKVDKPSGTALWLQEALEKVVGKSIPEPLAIRGGGIFGVHRVHAMTDEETLTFEHQALNREVFARGALVAAKWIKNRPAGLYKMTDVLSTEG